MNWPGKADCFKTIQQPSMTTLVPGKVESVASDTTENLIVEGDNLGVLKLLQKSCLGRVRMIYIDPPYNTGNDICLATQLTPEVIKSMASRKPGLVVCQDEGFAGNDQLKANAVQTMMTKGVTSFRAV